MTDLAVLIFITCSVSVTKSSKDLDNPHRFFVPVSFFTLHNYITLQIHNAIIKKLTIYNTVLKSTYKLIQYYSQTCI